jgi:trehalose 6-phosphate phosphatase
MTAAPHRRRACIRALPAPSLAWAWFFDLDGTLIEFASSPDGVSADDTLRGLLGWLAAASGGAVAIITGRAIVDVDRLFPALRLPVAGQHGVERRDVQGVVSQHALGASMLDPVRGQLAAIVARHPGLLLEDKGLSLALHYRLAPQLASFVHTTMRAQCAALGDTFCVQGGKFVAELKPAGRDKGLAIREFMSESPFEGRRPAFVGDDLTDEYGFDVVNELGGVSVKVGSGDTQAAFAIRDVRSVRAWLSGLRDARGLE